MLDCITNHKVGILQESLYALFDLDRESAQRYELTSDATFKALCEEGVYESAIDQFLAKISGIKKGDYESPVGLMAMTTKCKLFNVQQALINDKNFNSIMHDSEGAPVLHLGFRRYLRYCPLSGGFAITQDIEGDYYVHTPCCNKLTNSVMQNTYKVPTALVLMTTALHDYGNTMKALMNGKVKVLDRFLYEVRNHDQLDTGHMTCSDVLEHTTIEYTSGKPVFDMDNTANLIQIESAVQVNGALLVTDEAVTCVRRVAPNKYQTVSLHCYTDFNYGPTADAPAYAIEYAIVASGIRCFYHSFEFLASPTTQLLPCHYNTEEMVMGFNELLDLFP